MCGCRGHSGIARSERLNALQHGRVDNVHEEHGLEKGVGELRLLREQLPRLLGLRRDESLESAASYASCGFDAHLHACHDLLHLSRIDLSKGLADRIRCLLAQWGVNTLRESVVVYRLGICARPESTDCARRRRLTLRGSSERRADSAPPSTVVRRELDAHWSAVDRHVLQIAHCRVRCCLV